MRHYDHTNSVTDAEVEAAAEEFDRSFKQQLEEEGPEGALLRGKWKRGIDRRSYGRKQGLKSERATHQVKELWADHHTILDLKVAGLSNKQVAATVGCTPAKVSNTCHSALGQAKLTAAQLLRDAESVDVVREVTRMLPKALAVYEEILDSDAASLNLKKATADTLVMKIGGYEAAKKVEVKSAHFNAADFEAMRERGLAAAKAAGLLVEGVVVSGGES